jgi:hypothetical protein
MKPPLQHAPHLSDSYRGRVEINRMSIRTISPRNYSLDASLGATDARKWDTHRYGARCDRRVARPVTVGVVVLEYSVKTWAKKPHPICIRRHYWKGWPVSQ